MLKVAGFALAVAAAWSGAPHRAAPGLADIAGQWSQSSQGKELVLVTRIRLQPNVGVGTGTSLGGTTGYGSMTRTAIVTELAPMDVARSMAMVISEDGRFEWTITRRHAGEGGCMRTTTQEKRGTVRLEGGALVFAIAGGTESWRSSCGKQGGGVIAAASERYAMTVQDRALHLASGPSNWTFRRR
jgi:hypothetical protein